MVGRNVRCGRDEIDLVVFVDGARVAVEVKSRWRDDPVVGFTPSKAARVRRAAASLGIQRVDLVTVAFGPDGAGVRHVPHAG